MKPSKIREFTADELMDKLKDFQEKLLKLRVENLSGQLKNKLEIRIVRKDIARIKTILKGKMQTDEKNQIQTDKTSV